MLAVGLCLSELLFILKARGPNICYCYYYYEYHYYSKMVVGNTPDSIIRCTFLRIAGA